MPFGTVTVFIFAQAVAVAPATKPITNHLILFFMSHLHMTLSPWLLLPLYVSLSGFKIYPNRNMFEFSAQSPSISNHIT